MKQEMNILSHAFLAFVAQSPILKDTFFSPKQEKNISTS